ncbi:hypothetical protein F5884DRAFT_818249 [Xylogone sp. PMI_703]|nr:hypothetical protein F5884DRAFT_818249 [Xylogone sp. PMI_703]
MLCSNRPEGFGPSSKLSHPLPTSCFVDTILIPLPTWLSLVFALYLLIATFLRLRKHGTSTAGITTSHLCQGSYFIAGATTTYYILITSNALMITLEVIRLSVIHIGITLLPFAYAGLILVILLHWSNGLFGRIKGWVKVNFVVLFGGMAVNVVKAVGLVREGIHGRKESKYPVSDQVIDVAIMAGLYAFIALLEVGLAIANAKRKRDLSAQGIFGVGVLDYRVDIASRRSLRNR